MKLFIASIIIASLTNLAQASEINFAMPIACDYGKDCFIQNYTDVDLSPDYQDYTCAKLSYDKHTGTDFRLKNYLEIDKNYSVIAAREGIVKGVRDGVEDILYSQDNQATKNRECGNGLVITHDGGFDTQYCHLKKGSILVKTGDVVKTGTALGYVGLSGMTVFPHLHFEIRKDGKAVDPFTGVTLADATATCGKSGDTLWDVDTAAKLKYIPTALLNSGFSDKALDSETARKTPEHEIAVSAEALVFWVDVMGLKRNDVLKVSLATSDGRILAKSENIIDRAKATYFALVGKKWSKETFKPDTYIGKIEVIRDGKVALIGSKSIIIKSSGAGMTDGNR